MIASFNAWARECERRLLSLKLSQQPQLLLPQGQGQGSETVKTTNDEQTGAAAAAVTTLIPRKKVKIQQEEQTKVEIPAKTKATKVIISIKLS